jgi:putative transposase
MIEATEVLGEDVGIAEACRVLSVPRSSVYRARQPQTEPSPRPTPPRALSEEEKAEIRAILNSERFCDSSPREVYATLLDEDEVYHCHWRTMYTILNEYAEVRERRRQRVQPKRVKPELRATAPKQVWSWDITQLKGPRCFFYLYTIIDVFSRYLVGWMIAGQESGELAEKLIDETCAKQGIKKEQLILHSDRGSAMRSKTVKELLKALGVEKSQSRPYTPTDNPYSEAQFKTMKYRPDYPGEFEGITQARQWTRVFVDWYNNQHHHTGLALMTPATVHYGQVEIVREQRQKVLDVAYAAHPERFVGGRPTPPELPKEVWINQPKREHEETNLLAGLEASDREPGAQAESRAKSEASLDAGEHLAILEQPLAPADGMSILLPKFEPELCQSH